MGKWVWTSRRSRKDTPRGKHQIRDSKSKNGVLGVEEDALREIVAHSVGGLAGFAEERLDAALTSLAEIASDRQGVARLFSGLDKVMGARAGRVDVLVARIVRGPARRARSKVTMRRRRARSSKRSSPIDLIRWCLALRP
jgi:hypothetical protein